MPPAKSVLCHDVFVYVKRGDPLKAYEGNNTHWSIRRGLAEETGALDYLRDATKKGGAAASKEEKPTPGCTTAPFVWTRDKSLAVRGSPHFNQLVDSGLTFPCYPGELSQGLHKQYNKGHIKWPLNQWRRSMLDKGDQPYWYKCVYGKLSRGHKVDKNKLPA